MPKKKTSRADRFTYKEGDVTITNNPKGRVLQLPKPLTKSKKSKSTRK